MLRARQGHLPTDSPGSDIHAFRATELPQSATTNRPAHNGTYALPARVDEGAHIAGYGRVGSLVLRVWTAVTYAFVYRRYQESATLEGGDG